MAVLLLFNQNDSLTIEQILEQTQIETDSSRQVIFSLIKSKVLMCSQIPPDQLDKDLKDSDIKSEYTIEVDPRFSRFVRCLLNSENFHHLFFSKRARINLNQPIKTVVEKESAEDNRSVEEDRKILIQVNKKKTIFSFQFFLPFRPQLFE